MKIFTNWEHERFCWTTADAHQSRPGRRINCTNWNHLPDIKWSKHLTWNKERQLKSTFGGYLKGYTIK